MAEEGDNDGIPAALRLLRLMKHEQEILNPTAVKILFEERLARQESRADAIETRITETRNSILDLITAHAKAVDSALSAADRAVVKAELAADKRFDSVNEFRAALSDQTATLISRTEHASDIRAVTDRVDVVNKSIGEVAARLTRYEGRGSGYQQSWSIFIAIAGIVVLFVVELLRHS